MTLYSVYIYYNVEGGRRYERTSESKTLASAGLFRSRTGSGWSPTAGGDEPGCATCVGPRSAVKRPAEAVMTSAGGDVRPRVQQTMNYAKDRLPAMYTSCRQA